MRHIQENAKWNSRVIDVWQICDIFWLNCEFYDTSMTFDTQLEIVISKIFGYRAIADLPRDKRGSHFSKWPPPEVIVPLDGIPADPWKCMATLE